MVFELNRNTLLALFTEKSVLIQEKNLLNRELDAKDEGKVWWFDEWEKRIYTDFYECQNGLEQRVAACIPKLTSEHVATLTQGGDKSHLIKEVLDLIKMQEVAKIVEEFVEFRAGFPRSIYLCFTLDYLNKENNLKERATVYHSALKRLSEYTEKKKEASQKPFAKDFFPDLPTEEGPVAEEASSTSDVLGTVQKALEATRTLLRDVKAKKESTLSDKVTKSLRVLQLIVKEHQLYTTAATLGKLFKKSNEPAAVLLST